MDAYGATYVDFDIEGAAVADPASIEPALPGAGARSKQTHPGLQVSLTLPVLPEGLTADGLNVVRSATERRCRPRRGQRHGDGLLPRAVDYGDAARTGGPGHHDQLSSIYPGRPTPQLWAMVGVTPMLGENDDGRVYDQDDARQLVDFAQQHHVGSWVSGRTTRDRNACTGALYKCTNVPQQPYEFSKIFAGYTG